MLIAFRSGRLVGKNKPVKKLIIFLTLTTALTTVARAETAQDYVGNYKCTGGIYTDEDVSAAGRGKTTKRKMSAFPLTVEKDGNVWAGHENGNSGSPFIEAIIGKIEKGQAILKFDPDEHEGSEGKLTIKGGKIVLHYDSLLGDTSTGIDATCTSEPAPETVPVEASLSRICGPDKDCRERALALCPDSKKDAPPQKLCLSSLPLNAKPTELQELICQNDPDNFDKARCAAEAPQIIPEVLSWLKKHHYDTVVVDKKEEEIVFRPLNIHSTDILGSITYGVATRKWVYYGPGIDGYGIGRMEDDALPLDNLLRDYKSGKLKREAEEEKKNVEQEKLNEKIRTGQPLTYDEWAKTSEGRNFLVLFQGMLNFRGTQHGRECYSDAGGYCLGWFRSPTSNGFIGVTFMKSIMGNNLDGTVKNVSVCNYNHSDDVRQCQDLWPSKSQMKTEIRGTDKHWHTVGQ